MGPTVSSVALPHALPTSLSLASPERQANFSAEHLGVHWFGGGLCVCVLGGILCLPFPLKRLL